jgi:DNA-binding transcriptional ArsR family regulator
MEFTKLQLEKAAFILKTVAHPIRLGIIALLNQNEEMNVNEICKKLKSEQSLISHHLTNMKLKGLLSQRKEGQMVFYALKEKKLITIMECLKNCKVSGL